MPMKITKNNRKYYACKIRKFAYNDLSLAEKCESWCKKYKSCNLEIVKKAIFIAK